MTTDIMATLLALPDAIAKAEERRDYARASYEAAEVDLRFCALSAQLFFAKDGVTPRCAENADERKIAQERALSEALADGKSELGKLARRKEAAVREVTRLHNKLEVYILAVRREIAQMRADA